MFHDVEKNSILDLIWNNHLKFCAAFEKLTISYLGAPNPRQIMPSPSKIRSLPYLKISNRSGQTKDTFTHFLKIDFEDW